MPVIPTVLFQTPNRQIATLLSDRIEKSIRTDIVTGFATPGGLRAIDTPLKANPRKLQTLVIGAATYPAFDVLDSLISAGVSTNSLYVHLGHSRKTGGTKNPYARYHPMLHSKVYYMEHRGTQASAFIGSHNLTSFALGGFNGEAAVMLEGSSNSPEFENIRIHIDECRNKSTTYSPNQKEAYAWWFQDFIDGLRSEINIPRTDSFVRTILVFGVPDDNISPKIRDNVYLEIPKGIEQITSLGSEVHIFLFNNIPKTPYDALRNKTYAVYKLRCKILGAENQQGNREVAANWRVDRIPTPILRHVPSGTYRPTTPNDMQQVRATIESLDITPFEYFFERERNGWNPELSDNRSDELFSQTPTSAYRGGRESSQGWKLVTRLIPRLGSPVERDQIALNRATPESGAFILVSVRRRRKDELMLPFEDT